MAPANQSPPLQAPSAATDAVLKPSEPVPEGATEVQGIDFDAFAQRSITVEELVDGFARMGFQATAIGEAVRIINAMVSVPWLAAAPSASTCIWRLHAHRPRFCAARPV